MRNSSPCAATRCRAGRARNDEGAGGSNVPRAEVAAIDRRIRINERIRVREVRVIGENGEQIGVIPPHQAVALAQQAGLDLVEISPTAVPPVCRIMDFGKFLYERNKQAHAAKRKQKQFKLKEIKFRPGVDEHDYEFKKRNILKFLEHGDKVKASVFFRGREMAHPELGRKVLERLIADVREHGTVETVPLREGNTMLTILAPLPRRLQEKAQERTRDRQVAAPPQTSRDGGGPKHEGS